MLIYVDLCLTMIYFHDNSSKASAGGSQILNRWSLFWFLLLQLHLTGKQTHWVTDGHASDMAEFWGERTADV